MTMPEERECAIKIAASHADTIVIVVKCDERSEHDIEHARADYFAVIGFEQAESISSQFGFGSDFLEMHMRIFADDWDKNAFFHCPCARNYFPGVHFISAREIARYVFGAPKPGSGDDFFADES